MPTFPDYTLSIILKFNNAPKKINHETAENLTQRDLNRHYSANGNFLHQGKGKSGYQN